jgi:hypothetical protein
VSLNTTPRTWVASEFVTAAFMNTEVRDALTGLQAAWTAYTPALTASTTNPTQGNSTYTGSYMQMGKTVFYRVLITLGSTFNVGSGNYLISLPSASAWGINELQGSGAVANSSTIKAIVPVLSTSTTFVIYRISNEAQVGSAGPGAAWATGNTISIVGTYQVP